MVHYHSNINYGQSLHNQTVEGDVATSIEKLITKYLDLHGQEGTLEEALDLVEQLEWHEDEPAKWAGPGGLDKKTVAKKCLSRLMGNTSYTRENCSVTVPQILAMIAGAIKHSSADDHPFKEDVIAEHGLEESKRIATTCLVETLYRMQRQYNLDTNELDQGGDARKSCIGGHFNLCINGMQPVFADCDLRFVTKETINMSAVPTLVDCLLSLDKDVLKKAIKDADGDEEALQENLTELLESPLRQALMDKFNAVFSGLPSYLDDCLAIFLEEGIERIVDFDEDEASDAERKAYELIKSLKEELKTAISKRIRSQVKPAVQNKPSDAL